MKMPRVGRCSPLGRRPPRPSELYRRAYNWIFGADPPGADDWSPIEDYGPPAALWKEREDDDVRQADQPDGDRSRVGSTRH